ncbi:hypothetical protein ACQ4PT_013824 [Festuca glaucescens]
MAWNWNNQGPPPPLPPALHECPLCGKLLLSFQGLGCHLAWHRRSQPLAPHAPPAAPAPAAPAPIAVPAEGRVPRLAPNPAFWEEYRRGGPAPVEIDFIAQLAAAPAQPVVVNGDVPESSSNAGQRPADVTSYKE